MSEDFKDLKPGSDKRTEFWNKHKQRIFDLLTQINGDVFDGKGSLKENGYVGTYGTDMPPFTRPNLILEIDEHKKLGVCTESGFESFRVLYNTRFLNGGWRYVIPLKLVATLKLAVSEIVG